MILWTMQPVEIWNMIQETGSYRCDPEKNIMIKMGFALQYKWLVRQMKARIGLPPEGVTYPVWAWYMQHGRHKKPDLRSERWSNGPGNEKYTCIEFEIQDNQALLSDFDAWNDILNNGLIDDSKEESDQMEAHFNVLSRCEQKKYREENWLRVFDISPMRNEWTRRGEWVQATIWELRKEMIRDVRFFVTGKPKSDE